MPKKGHTNNPNGRPKGSKNEKTKAWERMGGKIEGELTELVLEEVMKLKGTQLVDAYTKILAYFKPKLAQVHQQSNIKINEPFTITLNGDSTNKKTD